VYKKLNILAIMSALAISAVLGLTAFSPRSVNAASNRSPSYQIVDSDSDGLSDSDELALGTDPHNVDSDCDLSDDGAEVGNPLSPTNSDSDALIDALENNRTDSDADSGKDNVDPGTGVQATCGRFIPFAIANNGSDTTRLEIRVTGGNGVSAVSVQAPRYTSGSARLRLDGADLASEAAITLYNDGTHGDQQAGDTIWTRGGFTSVYLPYYITGRTKCMSTASR